MRATLEARHRGAVGLVRHVVPRARRRHRTNDHAVGAALVPQPVELVAAGGAIVLVLVPRIIAQHDGHGAGERCPRVIDSVRILVTLLFSWNTMLLEGDGSRLVPPAPTAMLPARRVSARECHVVAAAGADPKPCRGCRSGTSWPSCPSKNMVIVLERSRPCWRTTRRAVRVERVRGRHGDGGGRGEEVVVVVLIHVHHQKFASLLPGFRALGMARSSSAGLVCVVKDGRPLGEDAHRENRALLLIGGAALLTL